jgi:hypothetical protein
MFIVNADEVRDPADRLIGFLQSSGPLWPRRYSRESEAAADGSSFS